MARDFSKVKNFYRAAIVAVKKDQTKIEYCGPYPGIGTAKGEVTKHRKGSDECIALRDGWKFVDGWVEKSEIVWKKLKD